MFSTIKSISFFVPLAFQNQYSARFTSFIHDVGAPNNSNNAARIENNGQSTLVNKFPTSFQKILNLFQ
jgi:hypothetical protein